MPALAPAFRIPQAVIDRDLARIRGLGVEFRLRSPLARPPEELLGEGYDAVFVAVGLPADAPWGSRAKRGGRLRGGGLPPAGPAGSGPRSARGSSSWAGERGDGRGADRLPPRRPAGHGRLPPDAEEMPADREEVDELLREGNEVLELVAPVAVVRRDGRVVALRLLRTRLGAPGPTAGGGSSRSPARSSTSRRTP